MTFTADSKSVKPLMPNLQTVGLPRDSSDDGSWSWYVRGAFGVWTDQVPDADARLNRLAGTDFCLRLSAREAPRLQPRDEGHAARFDIRHWHFHAGPLMRSSGRHEGWGASLGQSADHTEIVLSGVDAELGRVVLVLRFALRDGRFDPTDVGVFDEGYLQHGKSEAHRLVIRRAAARCMQKGNDHAA